MSEQYLTVDRISTKDLTRLFSKISINPAIQWNGSPCWGWAARVSDDGYGQFWWQGTMERAHRVLYAWLVGKLPKRYAFHVDHLCRNRACCNPVHLEMVTAEENAARSNAPPTINKRKTHCVRGHEFTDSNTKIERTGSRRCVTCKRDDDARRRTSKSGRDYHREYLRRWRRDQALTDDGESDANPN